MGRIKTGLVKKTAMQLIKAYGDEFTTDFNKNKEIIDKNIKLSKKLRNTIAGYIVRIKKKEKISNAKLNLK
ncbi:MAG: 30S ribosomal protein S17e [Candidatus Pacearchaeota archaeon]